MHKTAKLASLLESLFDPSELVLFVGQLPNGPAIQNAIPWERGHTTACAQVAAVLDRRGETAELRDRLLSTRPGRAADVESVFGEGPRDPQRTSDALRHHYSPEQVERRAGERYSDSGALLVRDSLDWATAKGMFVLPQVIERSHLMARDVFTAAEMAIVLLLRPPKLRIEAGRALLDVDLRNQSYGIYNNKGKQFLADYYLDEANMEHLRTLGRQVHEALLSKKTRDVPLVLDTETIPYRWASGGILPIVRWRGRWWCALFWRDIRPIGWNLANGASEDKEEYKDLERLMWREAREELVILARDPTTAATRNTTVVTRHLVPDADVPPLGNCLAHHHRLRAEQDKWRIGYPEEWNDQRAVRATSLPGPHQVRIHYHKPDGEGSETRDVSNILLSINPLEFGIEVVRIAYFDLHDDDYLVDGEVLEAHGARPHLIRRPVGLVDLAALYRAWRRRGALGEDVTGDEFLEGRRVTEIQPHDMFVFDVDIRARRVGIGPLMQHWNRRFGHHFDRLLQGKEIPEILQILCPVTWRVLELAFAHELLDAGGPRSKETEHV